MSKKLALGRGLDALLGTKPQPQTSAAQPESPTDRLTDRLIEIPLQDIESNPDQPRQQFDPEKMSDLVQSIKAQGIIQPIVVRRDGARYSLVAGERRVRAAKEAGMARIPARVIEDTPEGSLEKALVENIQREDLNPIHEALAYLKLQDREGLTQEQIAQRVGKNRTTIANTLRLLRLPQAIQTDILTGRLSEGHARAILTVDEAKRQMEIRDRIFRDGLSVRQAEALAHSKSASHSRTSSPGAGRAAKTDAWISTVQEKMTLRLGVPVRIQARSARKGRIVIPYASLDEFERILAAIGVESAD